jgi:polar amino acid transport system substrate-binding protein
MRSLFGLLAAFILALATGAAAADVVKVGVANVPYGFVDPPGSAPQGYAVDLMNGIAGGAGLQIEIVPIPAFGEVIPALLDKSIDVAATNMFATAARKAMGIDFSDAVAQASDAMLVGRNDAKAYRSFDDLEGEVVGSIAGSVYETDMKKSGRYKEVRAYRTTEDLLKAISGGEIKAGETAADLSRFLLAKGGFPDIVVSESYVPAYSGTVHFGVRKGDPLLARIDAALARLKADGTVAALARKWAVVAPE